MRIAAFDAKDFNRSRVEESKDPKDPSCVRKKYKGFFSPLGAGLVVKDGEDFKKCYLESNKKLIKEFEIESTSRFFSSSQLKKELELSAAIAYSNQLFEMVADKIDLIHITYVILPPNTVSEVKVGGNKCPIDSIRSEEFIRKLGPSFSYITAWDFLRKRGNAYEIHLDGFRAKKSIAWDEFIDKTRPKIFPHGDECNCYISMADIIAFLTDVRLYQRDPGPANDPMLYRGLRPKNVQDIWKNNGVEIECHFIDHSQVSKIAWYSNDHIDITHFLARPTVFFLADQVEKTKTGGPDITGDQTVLDTEVVEEPKKFSKVVQNLDPFRAALTYAEIKGGCLQMFDKYIDSDKIKDGDIIVYMGDGSKKIAMTYDDGFDVEVIKAKDLRKMVKELNRDS
jgi:hypothetical protein